MRHEPTNDSCIGCVQATTSTLSSNLRPRVEGCRIFAAIAEGPECLFSIENKTPGESTWRDPSWTQTCLWAEGEREIANELHIENRQFRWAHQCSSNQQTVARF